MSTLQEQAKFMHEILSFTYELTELNKELRHAYMQKALNLAPFELLTELRTYAKMNVPQTSNAIVLRGYIDHAFDERAGLLDEEE